MSAIIAASLLGIIVMFLGAFHQQKALLPVVVLGLVGCLGLCIKDWNTATSWYNDMVRFDNYAVAFSSLMIIVTTFLFLFATYYLRFEDSHIADIYALMLFSLVGGILMVSFADLTMVFIGVEVLSIPLYILAGSRRTLAESNEASLKYFLMGSFASCFLLFGIALVYGMTGTFNISKISDALNTMDGQYPFLLTAGVLMILVSFCFKISAVPFHFWAPDVYQGAPTFVTAFMSTVVKIAGIAGFYRLFSNGFMPVKGEWVVVLSAISAATILVANFIALSQTQVKRMLAYSSISHAGYLLLPILAMSAKSGNAIFYYTAVYAFASLCAFGVLFAVSGVENELSIEQFNGFIKKNPFLAVVLIISMLSLAGIPPLAGFLGKYYLFTTAIEANLVWLVVAAVIGSAISIYYYFKLIISAVKSDDFVVMPKVDTSLLFNIALGICLLVVIVLGIYPGGLMNLI